MNRVHALREIARILHSRVTRVGGGSVGAAAVSPLATVDHYCRGGCNCRGRWISGISGGRRDAHGVRVGVGVDLVDVGRDGSGLGLNLGLSGSDGGSGDVSVHRGRGGVVHLEAAQNGVGVGGVDGVDRVGLAVGEDDGPGGGSDGSSGVRVGVHGVHRVGRRRSSFGGRGQLRGKRRDRDVAGVAKNWPSSFLFESDQDDAPLVFFSTLLQTITTCMNLEITGIWGPVSLMNVTLDDTFVYLGVRSAPGYGWTWTDSRWQIA